MPEVMTIRNAQLRVTDRTSSYVCFKLHQSLNSSYKGVVIKYRELKITRVGNIRVVHILKAHSFGIVLCLM